MVDKQSVVHPTAVNSTLLDTYLTPAMFWLFGRREAERLLAEERTEAL